MKQAIKQNKLKLVFLFIWLAIISLSLWKLLTLGVSFSQLPQLIAKQVLRFGIWSPVIFISLFAIRPVIFFPATLLSLSAGVLFGPIKAVIILIIAENISSLVSYSLGKYFGQSLIETLDKKNTLLYRFEKYFHQNDFISIITLRLLYAPFDLLGYFAGASNIRYRSFALATFLGILPGLATVAFLGGAIYSPTNLAVSGIFFIMGIIISKFIKAKYELKQTTDQ